MEQQKPYSEVSQPYSAEHYQGIRSSLRQACKAFEERGAADLVYTKVRDVFLKHGVEDIFSCCLIHRHFDILPTERNVEQGGKAVARSDLDSIYPSSWMFRDGKLYPYEYKGYNTACPPAEFVKEYGEIVREANMEDILGFQVYEDGIVGFETTDRDQKVSTTVDVKEEDVTEAHLEGQAAASWAFFRPVEVESGAA